MVKILHFADAHIDMANYGQHDPKSGLPVRVMDYLKSLDTIIDTAIAEKVDLVLFAGDTYRDRNPIPTFQREWGRRIMRLSRASIPTLLLTGNHDISPAQLRAHAMQEFETLSPEFIHVVSRPQILKPEDLDGTPVQIIALPWVTRSGILASKNNQEEQVEDTALAIEEVLGQFVESAKTKLDPDLPTILTAHATVSGAKFGNEQTIKIGKDVMLQRGFVCDKHFDYVALGHIHKYQDMNDGFQPPVIYPGSIERVDFGEVNEEKGFILAEVSKGHTDFTWRKLNTRAYIDRFVSLEDEAGVNEKLLAALPDEEEMADAVVRLSINYPRDFETLIDERLLRERGRRAFEFDIVKKPVSKSRGRLPEGQEAASMPPEQLLDLYWKQNHVEEPDRLKLTQLATAIINQVESGEPPEG